MSNRKNNIKAPRKWLDEPSNIRKLTKLLYWLCGIVILADIIFSFFWHKHPAFSEEFEIHSYETLPTFYGIYGFLTCSALLYVSKFLQSIQGSKFLTREENYWNK